MTGTIQRNHIGAVHVFRLHRGIHTIHVTTCLSSYTCWYASLARERAGRNLEQVSNTPHHRTSLFKSPHTDCSNPSTPQSTQHPSIQFIFAPSPTFFNSLFTHSNLIRWLDGWNKFQKHTHPRGEYEQNDGQVRCASTKRRKALERPMPPLDYR